MTSKARFRSVALVALTLVGTLVALAWFMQPVGQPMAPIPDVQARPIATTSAKPAESARRSRDETPHEPHERATVPPAVVADGLIAERFDLLHVRCNVGTEYSSLSGVGRDGWFSMTTKNRQGSRTLRHDWESHLILDWNAPDNASSVVCDVTQPAWATLNVTILEEDGTPAAQVGLTGCGASGITDTEGRAEFQVFAGRPPCTLEAFRLLKEEGVYSAAYRRLGTLVEHEQRSAVIPLADYALWPDGVLPRFDWEEAESLAPGTNLLPTELEPPTTTDFIVESMRTAMYHEERIAGLRELRETAPPDVQRVVDDRIRYSLGRMPDRAAVEAAMNQGDVDRETLTERLLDALEEAD